MNDWEIFLLGMFIIWTLFIGSTFYLCGYYDGEHTQRTKKLEGGEK